jgi:hypothetical protein
VRSALHLACALVVVVAPAAWGQAGGGPGSTPAAPDPWFKIAFWNIQSGFGERPLPGRTCPFTEGPNCTDPSRPMNAWGLKVVQAELIEHVRNDPAVVALGLAEAWRCGTAPAVQEVLGWKARSTQKNGLSIVSKHGFAGPEEWLQLDTTRNSNPKDTKWVLRVPVCLDASCTRSMTTYTAHWYSVTPSDDLDYEVARFQGKQTIDFMAARSPHQPHVFIGDLNAFEGSRPVCGHNPRSEPIRMLRAAGYIDAWPAVHGSAEGATGMWNRRRCGEPEGYLWKRIDYAWSKGLVPVSMARFGMVTPGECAPSDHAGIVAGFAEERQKAGNLLAGTGDDRRTPETR